MTSRNQGLFPNDKGRQRRESLGTRLASLRLFSLYYGFGVFSVQYFVERTFIQLKKYVIITSIENVVQRY